MSLNLEEKKAVVAEVSAQVAQAQTIVLAEYRGLTVEEMTVLRKKARESGVYLARAEKHPGAPRSRGYAVCRHWPTKWSARLRMAFPAIRWLPPSYCTSLPRPTTSLVIKAGAMPNVMMSAKDVANLASMPSRRRTARPSLLGTMQAPITQFVRTLNEVPTKFVRALAAVRDRKQAA